MLCFGPIYNYSMIAITAQKYGLHYFEIKINVWDEHLKMKEKNTALLCEGGSESKN